MFRTVTRRPPYSIPTPSRHPLHPFRPRCTTRCRTFICKSPKLPCSPPTSTTLSPHTTTICTRLRRLTRLIRSTHSILITLSFLTSRQIPAPFHPTRLRLTPTPNHPPRLPRFLTFSFPFLLCNAPQSRILHPPSTPSLGLFSTPRALPHTSLSTLTRLQLLCSTVYSPMMPPHIHRSLLPQTSSFSPLCTLRNPM